MEKGERQVNSNERDKILGYQNIEVLYYLFPLIEKTVVDYLKLEPEANIEIFEQGTYRTLNSIVQDPKNRELLGHKVAEKIVKYYDTNGLRNKFLHYSEDCPNNIDKSILDEINELYIETSSMLNSSMNRIERISNKKIEHIKL